MNWEGITAIVGLLTALVAVLGLVYKAGKMNAKIEVLWEIFKIEARQNIGRRGDMTSSSEYHLTEKGQGMIPVGLKEEIKTLVTSKKLNPGKAKTWDIIGKLGGVTRLTGEAEKAEIPLGEFVIMVETFIQKHLNSA